MTAEKTVVIDRRLELLHLRSRLSDRGVVSAPPTDRGKGSTFPARPSPLSLLAGEARPRRAPVVACTTASYPGRVAKVLPRTSRTARWITASPRCGGEASRQEKVQRIAARKRRSVFTEQWAKPCVPHARTTTLAWLPEIWKLEAAVYDRRTAIMERRYDTGGRVLIQNAWGLTATRVGRGGDLAS